MTDPTMPIVDTRSIEDGLWYLGNMARTHDSIAAVLRRYYALEAENAELRAAASDPHALDARELGY